MDVVWQYVLVFAAAAVPMLEVMVVVPAAIATGMSPVAVGVVAFAGNAVTVTVAVYATDVVARFVARRRPRKFEGPPVPDPRSIRRRERASRIAGRWGLPGVALLAPLTIGTHVAAVTAVALRLPRRAVLIWVLGALAGWTAVFTALATYGRSLL